MSDVALFLLLVTHLSLSSYDTFLLLSYFRFTCHCSVILS